MRKNSITISSQTTKATLTDASCPTATTIFYHNDTEKSAHLQFKTSSEIL